MAAILREIVRFALRVIRTLKMIVVSGAIKEVAVAKVIEFYIPTNFRKSRKWVPKPQCGKIIEFCPQRKKSA
jgi:hypothetical protein